MTKPRRSRPAGKMEGTGQAEQKQPRSSVPQAAFTEFEMLTFKHVIFGYLGFLRNIVDSQPERASTITLLQAIYDRLFLTLESDRVIYFPHEELAAILEAVIGFKLLLATCFPQTARRDVAMVDVDGLLQAFMRARSLSLN